MSRSVLSKLRRRNTSNNSKTSALINATNCHYCNFMFKIREREYETNPGKCHSDFLTLDHKHERVNGGTCNLENLIPACYLCNNIRGSNFQYSVFCEFVISYIKPYRHDLKLLQQNFQKNNFMRESKIVSSMLHNNKKYEISVKNQKRT